MSGLAHDTALEEQSTSDDALAEVHVRALRRFDECSVPTQELRRQSLEARRFVTVPGAQWEGVWGEQFEKSIRVEVNKVGRGVRKIETDYRQNRIVPDFRPDGDKADAETANMLDGLHRADSYRFKSQQARDNAVFEAIAGGFGAYRLTNEWEDEADKDNDYQRINPAALIVDADQSVFFDMNARLYDKADARFAFIRTAMTKDAFEEAFGEDEEAGRRGYTDFPDHSVRPQSDWFTPDTVSIAEYYEMEEVSETLHVLKNKLSDEEKRIWASDLMEGELAQMRRDGWADRRQNRKRRRVHKYVMSGAEILEDLGHIAGECIPIVPVYGQRYFVENQERWKGYVQDKMDPQRLYNSNVSKLAETNSLAPREVPIFAPEQMSPAISDQWARANIDRLAYLLAEPIRNDDNSIAHMGPIGKLEPPQLSPVLASLLQIANGDLLEDMEDSSEQIKANTSAEAMDLAATRVDAKSGIYLDNVRQSVQREGEIYLSMGRDIYADRGRKIDTMTEDGDDNQAVLMKMVEGGRVINDLVNAKYKVVASVTEATATRRDKTVKAMLSAAEVAIQAQDPQLAQAAILTALANMDGEGIDEFHDWCRKRGLDIGLFKPTDEERQAMDEAAENATPDPMAQVAEAQAAELASKAQKNTAEIAETEAATKLKEAQTIETLAKAGATRREAMFGRVN